MDLKEIGQEGLNSLTQDKNERQTIVNMVRTMWILHAEEYLLLN